MAPGNVEGTSDSGRKCPVYGPGPGVYGVYVPDSDAVGGAVGVVKGYGDVISKGRYYAGPGSVQAVGQVGGQTS